MAPDDPGAAHAAPELAALLAAREDELRAVEASAAARTLDTKVRAKQFFDDVVEKMRAGARQAEALERNYRAAAAQRDAAAARADKLEARAAKLDARAAAAERQRDASRRDAAALGDGIRHLRDELDESRARLAAARDAEAAAAELVRAGAAERDAARAEFLRERDDHAAARDALARRVAALETENAELRDRLRTTAEAEQAARDKLADKEKLANEHRGRAYVLEEELKKQRKKVDECVLEERRRGEEERARGERERVARRAGPRGAFRSSRRVARAGRRSPHAYRPRRPSGPRAAPPAAAWQRARFPTQAARAEADARRERLDLERTEAEAAARAESERLHAAKLEEDLARAAATETRARLVAGVDCRKHGRAGNPKARRLFLDPRTDELAWGPAGAKKSGSKGAAKRFPLVRGVRLVRGKTTAVFRRQASVDASPNACLSLVGDGPRESLDLELDSKQLRDTLATGIAALLVRLDAPATA